MQLPVLRCRSVGDFDFDQIYDANPIVAIVLFWTSALLITFVLINIFIAIIMNAYDATLKLNPDAADASNFVSMVVMQAKRVLAGAVGVSQEDDWCSTDMPMVLDNTMGRIGDEEYWDIFEGYFDLPSSDEDEHEDDTTNSDEAGPVAQVLSGGRTDKLASLAREVFSIKQQQAQFQATQEAKLNEITKQQQELLTIMKSIAKIAEEAPGGGEPSGV